MKRANHNKRLSDLEGKNKVANALFSLMANSQSEQSNNIFIQSNYKNIDLREEIDSNKKEIEIEDSDFFKPESPLSKDIVSKPFYNGPVHPNDLQPIYSNWILESNKHGEKGQEILRNLKLDPQKISSEG